MSHHPLAILDARRAKDEHSPVGASGRQRWSVCPGSVALVATLPQGVQSSYAAWGSEAHGYAEKGLRYLLQAGPKPPKIADPEMKQCVTDYLEAIGELLEQYAGEERRIWIEERCTLPGFDGEAYGTVDFAVYFPRLKLLIVVDLKTGSGMLVASRENKQLLYYAAGFMFQEHLEVATCRLVISAPRAPEDHQWSSWQIDGTRLFEELGSINAEIAATKAKDAPLVSGDHCAKSFCPAMAICPARRAEAFEVAVADFAPVKSYDREQLARSYLVLDRVEAWCKAVSQFAHAEAYAGRTPPGLKLVNKRLGNRKWKDEKAVRQVLLSAEVLEANIYDHKLKSPAQMEKLALLGSTTKELEGLTVRESSGTTLVPESDSRPAAVLSDDFAAVGQHSESEMTQND